MPDNLTITGIASVSDALYRLADSMLSESAIVLNAIAEATMTDAKEHTPVQYGVLRRSGKVDTHAEPTRLHAVLSFGTEYGVYVHEDLRARHHVGEAKFLENAVKRAALTFERDVAAGLGVGKGHAAPSPGGGGLL